MIYSKKYILGLHHYTWHRASKTLGIYQVIREMEGESAIHNKPLSTTPEFMLMRSIRSTRDKEFLLWLSGLRTQLVSMRTREESTSYGVGHRCGLDPQLLWLWCRLAAIALI